MERAHLWWVSQAIRFNWYSRRWTTRSTPGYGWWATLHYRNTVVIHTRYYHALTHESREVQCYYWSFLSAHESAIKIQGENCTLWTTVSVNEACKFLCNTRDHNVASTKHENISPYLHSHVDHFLVIRSLMFTNCRVVKWPLFTTFWVTWQIY